MNNVVDLKKYKKSKTPRKPFPWPWNQPRTIQKVSREALLLMSFATTGVLSSHSNFVVIPCLCAIASLVIILDLLYLAFRADDTDGNSPPRDAA